MTRIVFFPAMTSSVGLTKKYWFFCSPVWAKSISLAGEISFSCPPPNSSTDDIIALTIDAIRNNYNRYKYWFFVVFGDFFVAHWCFFAAANRHFIDEQNTEIRVNATGIREPILPIIYINILVDGRRQTKALVIQKHMKISDHIHHTECKKKIKKEIRVKL